MNDNSIVPVLVIGIVIGIIMAALIFHVISIPTSSTTEILSFTVIDHDESDLSVYTSEGKIYHTNKYQWKRLELNKTYMCERPLLDLVDCHEQPGVVP